MPQRSTTLKMVEKYCPASLDLYEANVPYDRDVFAVGIAAHAVLEALTKAMASRGSIVGNVADALAESVATRLVSEGRSFDGVPEAPMRPADAAAGRDIALRWWHSHREASPYPSNVRAEVALAMDENGKHVPYSKTAYYRGVIDALHLEEVDGDEWSGGIALVNTDYKSAWPTNASELETIQLRGQALLALAEAEASGVTVDILRRRVVNLRTHAVYEADLYLADDGTEAVLAGWRKDLALAIAHAEARGPDGKRQASPGPRCFGCPYVLRCEAARSWWDGSMMNGSAEDIARTYAVAQAIRDAMVTSVKQAVGKGSIHVDGGTVGYSTTAERTAAPGAAEKLALAWFTPADPSMWVAQNGHLLSLLSAMGVTSGAVDKVATVLYPARGPNKVEGFKEARAEFAASLLTTKSKAEFGITRDVPSDEESERVPSVE